MPSQLDRHRLSMNHPLLAVAVCYAPFLLAMQYSKHKWLITHPESVGEYLPILHSELLLFCLFALLVSRLRGVWVGYAILTLYYLVSLSDDLTWFALGRPFHPEDVMRSIELMSNYSEFVTVENIGWKRMLYSSIPAGAALALATLQHTVRSKRLPREPWLGPIGWHCGCAVFVFFLLLLPFSLSRSYLHYNSMVRIAKQISYDLSFEGIEVPAQERNRLLGPPATVRGEAPRQKLNVIVYVLETAPADLYPDLAATFTPWAGRNGCKIVSMPEHYSTYPESDRSMMSIMTGKYPCLERGSNWVDSYDYGRPLPKVLAEHGYRTYLLSVAPLKFHRNDVMARNLGFGNIEDSEHARKAVGEAKKKKLALDRTALYPADEELLLKALEIIGKSGDEPYLITFMPQASHAPFQVPPGYGGAGGQRELLEGNAMWQFGLIDRILKKLEETGHARKTVLLIVGDHGLRHPSESSLFQDQTVLNPITFKVASAILLPKELAVLRSNITSHVDIAPTLLDLLSIQYDGGRYHGRSIRNRHRRSVFFLGGDYLPVNGFTANGWYFMENINRDIVMKSREFRFDRDHQVRVVTDSDERSVISHDLALIKALVAN